MKTTNETRLLIASVKEVFRNADTYKMVCDTNNTEALAEAEDFRVWLPQQTEEHFAQPIEEAIENGIPSDSVSLANYVLWWYQEDNNETITFETI